MIRIPSRAAIEDAERRLNHARQNTSSGFARARLRFREKIARPASIAMLAGAAGVLAFWLAPRRRRKASAVAGQRASSAFLSHPILLSLAEVSIRALPFALWRMRVAQERRGDGSQASGSSSPAAVDAVRRS